MALTHHYTLRDYTVSHRQAGKIVVSAQIIHDVKDETGETLRNSAFRAEWLDDAVLQRRADARGADARNKLPWHDADVVEVMKEWLAKKRYENPTNVTMLKVEPPEEAP